MSLCICCPEGHRVQITADKLGQSVACPACFAVFLAELDCSTGRGVRKEEKKPRRARDDDDDDDDDDEEEETPRKKKPAVKAESAKKKDAKAKDSSDQISEKPLPAAKKKPSRRDDDDDDEDGDEEEEEEHEAEPEINWTPRKRQLNLCVIGLYVTIGAFVVMIIFTATLAVTQNWFIYGVMALFQAQIAADRISTGAAYAWMAAFIAGPFFTIAQVVLMVALFFSLSVPAKAEARSSAIAGIVFGLFFFLFGLMALLAEFQVVVSDEIRAERLEMIMGLGAGLCFIISLMSTMAFQSKLMMFMNMKLEASQAVTNVGFYFVYLAGMLAFLFASVIICNYLHYFLGYALILATLVVCGMAGRILYSQISLMLKVQKTIFKYIRESV